VLRWVGGLVEVVLAVVREVGGLLGGFWAESRFCASGGSLRSNA
jgi:hypothetical protein